MTAKSKIGPLARGSWATKSVVDVVRSRTQIKYVIVESDVVVLSLTISDAITFAIAQAAVDPLIASMNPDQASIALNNASGKRLGPKKVEVILTYANASAAPGQDPGSEQLMTMRLNTAQVQVWKRPYRSYADAEVMATNCDGTAGTPTCTDGVTTCWNSDTSTCIVPAITNGLPNGDWIDTTPVGAVQSFSGAAFLSFSNYPVPEVSIAIPAKLSNASYQGLFTALTGTMPYVGYFNTAAFTWNGIEFAAKSLRIDGIHADWVLEGSTAAWYVQYYLTWRPNGWYVQELFQDAANKSRLTTVIVEVAEPTVSFTVPNTRFPLS